MKNSRIQFIKEAHKSACSDWKQKIETEFPKIFPKTKLEVGKWYKHNDIDYPIVCVTKHQIDDWYETYGFNCDSEWMNGNRQGMLKNVIPATNEEVEEALIKEAKKRGFKKGDDVGNFNGIRNELIHSNDYVYSDSTNLFFMGGTCIFNNGKWATIVETITKKEAEKQLGKTII